MGTIAARRPNVFRVDPGAVSHCLAEVRRIAGAETGIVAALEADACGLGLERLGVLPGQAALVLAAGRSIPRA